MAPAIPDDVLSDVGVYLAAHTYPFALRKSGKVVFHVTKMSQEKSARRAVLSFDTTLADTTWSQTAVSVCGGRVSCLSIIIPLRTTVTVKSLAHAVDIRRFFLLQHAQVVRLSDHMLDSMRGASPLSSRPSTSSASSSSASVSSTASPSSTRLVVSSMSRNSPSVLGLELMFAFTEEDGRLVRSLACPFNRAVVERCRRMLTEYKKSGHAETFTNQTKMPHQFGSFEGDVVKETFEQLWDSCNSTLTPQMRLCGSVDDERRLEKAVGKLNVRFVANAQVFISHVVTVDQAMEGFRDAAFETRPMETTTTCTPGPKQGMATIMFVVPYFVSVAIDAARRIADRSQFAVDVSFSGPDGSMQIRFSCLVPSHASSSQRRRGNERAARRVGFDSGAGFGAGAGAGAGSRMNRVKQLRNEDAGTFDRPRVKRQRRG